MLLETGPVVGLGYLGQRKTKPESYGKSSSTRMVSACGQAMTCGSLREILRREGNQAPEWVSTGVSESSTSYLTFHPPLAATPQSSALPPRELGLQHLSTQFGFSALCWDVAPALPPLILALPGLLLPRANGAVSINSQHPSLLPSSARTVRLHEAAAGRYQSCVSHWRGLHQGGQIRGIWGFGPCLPSEFCRAVYL